MGTREISGTEKGGLGRHHFWREEGDVEDMSLGCLMVQGKKRPQKWRVLWKQKRCTKAEDTSTPPVSPKSHHLWKKLPFLWPRQHTQTQKPSGISSLLAQNHQLLLVWLQKHKTLGDEQKIAGTHEISQCWRMYSDEKKLIPIMILFKLQLMFQPLPNCISEGETR